MGGSVVKCGAMCENLGGVVLDEIASWPVEDSRLGEVGVYGGMGAFYFELALRNVYKVKVHLDQTIGCIVEMICRD
jgi:hypothetical protein